MAIKRTSADAAFSDCVRARVNYRCELCGKDYTANTQGLHCSHYYGRRHKRTRWEPLNASALCYGCHQKMGENPYEHTKFFQARLGSVFEVLDELHRQVLRKNEYTEKDIARHFREQLQKMQALRAEGVTGRLHLEGYF